MRIIENKRYLDMVDRLHEAFPYWERLEGKTLFLSGASGMIGSLLVDAIMLYNKRLPPERRCGIIAAGRNRAAAEERFGQWIDMEEFTFLEHDISMPLPPFDSGVDYLIHAASTTHPLAYSSEPVNTVLANVLGAHHMLDLAARKPDSRFLLLSSVEIYGKNRGDTTYFREDYCGYLDCNTLRAGYPEGKRASEALCQAYIQQYGVDAVILRLPRSYGPTMRMSDSKAIAQFIKKGVAREDIVLKSEGNQLYSYAHVSDAAQGILWALFCGKTGQAYNLSDSKSDTTLKALAELVAQYAGTKVVFDLPDETERAGYSTATKALLDPSKLKALGWAPGYDIQTGIRETIDILQAIR